MESLGGGQQAWGMEVEYSWLNCLTGDQSGADSLTYATKMQTVENA